uniref:Cathepsin Q n=1 Tax=Cricetulus griseus TaxID=10029 RepID=A0A8C2LCG0_CRIGR
MNPAVLLVILCIGVISGASALDHNLDIEWEEGKLNHEKSYSLEEEALRRAVWEKKNLKIIKHHNGENGLGKNVYTIEINEFGDMVKFKNMMIGSPMQTYNMGKGIWKHSLSGLPKSVNWRKKGTCWAFSVTGAIEGQVFQKTGKLTPLNVQNLVDCSKPHSNKCCNWGNMHNVFQYVLHNGGVEAEATYPYEGKEEPFRYDPKNFPAKIKIFVALPEYEDILMDAVATKGPIAAGVDALYNSFWFYKEGIYHEPNCNSNSINHAILVVGYGAEGNEMDGNNNWLIKN